MTDPSQLPAFLLDSLRRDARRKLVLSLDITSTTLERFLFLEDVAVYLKWSGEYAQFGLTENEIRETLADLWQGCEGDMPPQTVSHRSIENVISPLLCDTDTVYPPRRPPWDSTFY